MNREVYQVNNLVTLAENLRNPRSFLNRTVEALGIIIDRRPKGRPRKREN